MLMCFLQDSRSQQCGAEPPAPWASAFSHHETDAHGTSTWLGLTSSEVRGSRHIGESVQVDDVNNRADHSGGILESRSKMTHDFRSHRSNWSRDALNLWRHQMAVNLGAAQVCQGQVPIIAASSSSAITSTNELLAAAPSGRGIAGSQGHTGERGWEGSTISPRKEDCVLLGC